MSEHTIQSSERAERILENKAEEFGVSKKEILNAKLKMRGVDQDLAASLFLDGKIDEVKASNYFDTKEIENLKQGREKLQSFSKQVSEKGDGKDE